MDERNISIYRTLIELLIMHGYKDVAAMLVDSDFQIIGNRDGDPEGFCFSIPKEWFLVVRDDDRIKKIISRALMTVMQHNLFDQWDNPIDPNTIPIIYRIKLVGMSQNWIDVVKGLIVENIAHNQGLITQKVFIKNNRQPYTYNEIIFASQSEIRIAQELEAEKVLFFPLALAVRAETGNYYQDHREVDFLVCADGAWGILEVSFHPDRFEKDAEKDAWFKKSGILCIQHYSAERCFQASSEVVSEFLSILAKHKR